VRKSIIPIILLLLITLIAKSQTKTTKDLTRDYGVIDTADLKMSTCDFEKDANAMVLFDKAVAHYDFSSVRMERHKRIKILNEKGNDETNIRIEYQGVENDEFITDIEAETINLENNKITYTPVDKKLIYNQKVDKQLKAIVFTFPNVHPGSIIEYRYKWMTPYPYNYPDWFFQTKIPCRYSEFDASFIEDYAFSLFKKVYQPMLKDTFMVRNKPKGKRFIWSMKNIKSYQEEPLMDYPEDYFQCVISRIEHPGRTWIKIADWLLNAEDFGPELDKTLNNEKGIIDKINTLKTDQEKIAYVFDTVRNVMTWDKINRCYCIDGIRKAWDKKTGNSTEINLILYHFLKIANVDAYLLELKTKNLGKIEIEYPSFTQINKTAILCKVDSIKYVLDATNKLNSYNIVPLDLAGLDVLCIEAISKKYSFLKLQPEKSVETTLTEGSIGADGKVTGKTNISSSSYSKVKFKEEYYKLGQKNYVEAIEKEYSGLKIDSLKIQNMASDTLPLNQSFSFNYNLTDPDGEYIYFSPNLLTGFSLNPFLSDTRISNIDFKAQFAYSINGRYKIPKGYKIDVLPKSLGMLMPDKSIIFKRVFGTQDDLLLVNFVIDFRKSMFSKDEYPNLSDFYKKMFEFLNEQIVLKKI